MPSVYIYTSVLKLRFSQTNARLIPVYIKAETDHVNLLEIFRQRKWIVSKGCAVRLQIATCNYLSIFNISMQHQL